MKASAGRYAQFLQSVRNEEFPVGLDVWVLASHQVPHVVSDQLQVGLEGYPGENWFLSLEGYVREFGGVATTNQAIDPNDLGNEYLPGNGRSYGADFFLRRSAGMTEAWISVSWLKAEQSFPDPLSGLNPAPDITFSPVFDRRLDVDLVLNRTLPGGLEAGVRFNFGTGLPYTRSLSRYTHFFPQLLGGVGLQWTDELGNQGAGTEMSYGVALSERHNTRYPARHRLDLSLRWPMRSSWGRVTPYLNVLNVYNRKNVLFYFYEYDKSPVVRTGLSMFPFLPTAGFEISF